MNFVKHLIYECNAHDKDGNAENWLYELWFFNEDRVVYAIHGKPMAGRKNFQAATYQCVRPGQIWQCNWLEETGTIVSLVYDIPSAKITTMLGFSKCHWEKNTLARGDKRNPTNFARWRDLANVGKQTDRVTLSEQVDILRVIKGPGDLEPIRMEWPTI